MKRSGHPLISASAEQVLAQYATILQEVEDLNSKTIRNYLSDLHQFIAWCEATRADGQEEEQSFIPRMITTPLLTRYRAYLQTAIRLKPASMNRALISLKRYCSWAADQGILPRDPAKVVKLVPKEAQSPRHISDEEEEALVATVTANGSLRDRTIIVFLLHTGLRAQECCHIQRTHIRLGKRSGTVQVYGKRNKYRDVPLNATVRGALEHYLPTLPLAVQALFPSIKTGEALTVRALDYIIRKYATQAHLADVSPHDLRHRFGYRMAESAPLHRLAQIMGHDSLDTTLRYVRGTKRDLQHEVEKIAWA